MTTTDPARLTIDTIRVLAMDAVQQANAGHPGTAMALAPVAYLLYAEEMRHESGAIGLAELLPHLPSEGALVEALEAGFCSEFGVSARRGELSDEEARTARRLEEKYRGEAWTWRH